MDDIKTSITLKGRINILTGVLIGVSIAIIVNLIILNILIGKVSEDRKIRQEKLSRMERIMATQLLIQSDDLQASKYIGDIVNTLLERDSDKEEKK